MNNNEYTFFHKVRTNQIMTETMKQTSNIAQINKKTLSSAQNSAQSSANNSILSTSTESSSPNHFNSKNKLQVARNTKTGGFNLYSAILNCQTFILRKPSLNVKTMFNLSNENSTNKYNAAAIQSTVLGGKQFENTVILKIKVKLSQNYYAVLCLRKYDDVFISLEQFFRTFKITKKELLLPLAYKIFATLSSISNIYNKQINEINQAYLKSMQQSWKMCYGK